jgi:hypothetical protein
MVEVSKRRGRLDLLIIGSAGYEFSIKHAIPINPLLPSVPELEPDRFRKSIEPVETGIAPVETFEKCPLLTLFLVIKTKTSHILFGRVRKKVLKRPVNLIICSEVLFKKIDYVECLLHALLNYLIFGVIFLKVVFPKIRHFLTSITGWTCDFNRPVSDRTGPDRFTISQPIPALICSTRTKTR